jgi:hypothetical protein
MQNVKEWVRSNLPQSIDLYKRITAKKWSPKSIVYYVGKHKDGLTPHSLKEGTSGAHAAVIFITKEWAKLGYDVTVYSKCDDREGIYDGVNYVNYYKFNWHDTFDTLVIWKHPHLLNPAAKANRIWLEWQDVAYPEKDFTPEALKPFNKIFAKSYYQRQLLPYIADDKFCITTNGIDQSIFELSDKPKDPYKLIYASRYYRGLEHMLMYGWPLIKREVPEAELHVYYGWTRRDLDPRHADWRQKMEALLKQSGVFDHGKVGQDELLLEKATAAIHYYACTYEEVDCISVRESAIVGCVPVTTNYAVMAEKEYCVRIPGDPLAQETQEAIAYQIIELLKDRQQLEAIRQQMKDIPRAETWDNIAKTWLSCL